MRFNLPGRKIEPNSVERELLDEVAKHGGITNDTAWIIHLLTKQARQIDKLNEKLKVHIMRSAPRR